MNPDALAAHPFAKSFWPEHIDRLAAMASEVLFAPGEVVFREGDPSSLFYLLVSGSVALEVTSPAHPVRVLTLYTGDVLGWSSVTGETVKQFQARALEPVRALAFDGVRLRRACEEDYAFGFAFMRAIVTVLSGRIHAVRNQLSEVYSPVGEL